MGAGSLRALLAVQQHGQSGAGGVAGTGLPGRGRQIGRVLFDKAGFNVAGPERRMAGNRREVGEICR